MSNAHRSSRAAVCVGHHEAAYRTQNGGRPRAAQPEERQRDSQQDGRARRGGRPALDLAGCRFARLAVLGPAEGRSTDGHVLWRCRCDCGAEVVASSHSLRAGVKPGCGPRCPLRPRLKWAAAARRLRAQGKTLAQIGAIFGVTKQRAHQVLAGGGCYSGKL